MSSEHPTRAEDFDLYALGALDNLPKEQRAAIELAYFEGLTHSEIAQRTGDPLGTVKTRLRSAVETLKRDLHP